MFDTIDANKDVRTEVYASLDIRFGRKHKPATLNVKVDTGAQGNVLPLRIYRQMCPENLDTEGYPQPRSLKTCSTVLTAYNGERIVQYGTMLLPCTHRDAKCDAELYVADTPGPAIMGLPSCRALQLVTMHCEISSNEHDSAITQRGRSTKDLSRSLRGNWKLRYGIPYYHRSERHSCGTRSTEMFNSHARRNKIGA